MIRLIFILLLMSGCAIKPTPVYTPIPGEAPPLPQSVPAPKSIPLQNSPQPMNKTRVDFQTDNTFQEPPQLLHIQIIGDFPVWAKMHNYTFAVEDFTQDLKPLHRGYPVLDSSNSFYATGPIVWAYFAPPNQ